MDHSQREATLEKLLLKDETTDAVDVKDQNLQNRIELDHSVQQKKSSLVNEYINIKNRESIVEQTGVGSKYESFLFSKVDSLFNRIF